MNKAKMPAGKSGAPMGKSGMPHGKRKIDFKMLGRVIKMVFGFYPRLYPIALACILFSAIVAAIPAVFIQPILDTVDIAIKGEISWQVASAEIVPNVLILAGLYMSI